MTLFEIFLEFELFLALRTIDVFLQVEFYCLNLRTLCLVFELYKRNFLNQDLLLFEVRDFLLVLYVRFKSNLMKQVRVCMSNEAAKNESTTSSTIQNLRRRTNTKKTCSEFSSNFNRTRTQLEQFQFSSSFLQQSMRDKKSKNRHRNQSFESSSSKTLRLELKFL